MIATAERAAPLSEAALATRGSGIRLAAELGSRAFALTTSLLLAAGLGVEAFGVFAAVSSVGLILSELGELGLQQTASRALVAGTFSLRAMVRARSVLTVALLAVAGLAPLVSRADWKGLLPAFTLYFGINGWSEFLGVALRARGHRVGEAVVLLATRAVTLAGVVAAVWLKLPLAVLAWILVGASVAPLLLASVLAWRTFGRRAGAHATSWLRPQTPGGELAPDHPVRDVLRASLPLAINGALALIALRIELLVIFWARGAWEAGLFGAAVKIVESLNGVPAAIAAGAMPALTREAMGQGRSSAVRSRTAVTVALLAVPAAAGLTLLAPGVLQILGSDYVAAAPALRVVAFAIVALFMNVVLLHSLIAAGRAAWLPRLTAIRVAFAGLAAIVLIPRLGVVGAAAGVLSAEALLLALCARACRLAGFAVPLAAPLGVALAASVPMAAVVITLGMGTIPSAAAGALVYAGTLALAWSTLREPLLRMLGTGEAA
jgi:O-antigen/teichoic acid export membrane protein